MTQGTTEIDLDMSMAEILERVPSAQRALFQRYHIGGCSACGFQPTDTLRQVCKDHNILDTRTVLQHILLSHELDQRMQMEPRELARRLAEGEALRFLDVRLPAERQADPEPRAEPLDYDDSAKYMGLPKDTAIVFACADGERALDVAAYFAGHGFTQVHSLRGGLVAWRSEASSR
jgi:rhodanese-related sulfurtransferase